MYFNIYKTANIIPDIAVFVNKNEQGNICQFSIFELVFHRILDYKRGWMSIQTLFFDQ